MDSLGRFDAGKATITEACSPRQMTVTENLEMRKQNLQAQLDRVNAALDALKANPAVENTLNLIQQASY